MADMEKQEGLQLEEVEALANEFTLEDLAEFDDGLEFEASDLDSIKPTYTKKQKAKMILMNNTVFSIIKWCIAGLGLVGLVFHILALVSPDISESLSTTVSAAVRGALAAVSNLLPISLMEILVLVVLAGILGYAGFLVYKSIKAKEGIKIAGIWVQFGYVLVAIFGFGYLLFALSYGVTTNRPMLYTSELKDYKPNHFTERALDSSMIYYTDKINEVAVEAIENKSIFYTPAGKSQYASTGKSLEEIGEAVNACFDLAAEDFGFAEGGKVVVKEMMATQLYSAMGIGSMFSPVTGEVLVNTDYPEVIIPMQVAKAIAKQRGITNDGDASMVAFLVCSQYADKLSGVDGDYNSDYIKYAAYMDAYLEVSNLVYKLSGADVHLYCGAALKESAKKDVIALIKEIDALHGNISNLEEFDASTQKTSTDDYKNLAKHLYGEYTRKVDSDELSLSYSDKEAVPPSTLDAYFYERYLVAYFTADQDWADDAVEMYEANRTEPEENNNPDDYKHLITGEPTK